MPTDRYPANPLDGPSGLAEELREIKRRLGELEAARPLGNTTISNGTLRVVDGNGDVRVQIGNLTAAGGSGDVWGIEVVSQPGTVDWPGGEPFFRATDDGAEFPYASAPMAVEAAVAVTSGTFVDVAIGGIGIVMHKYVSTIVLVTSDVGTTGEICIKDLSASTTSDAVAIGSGAAAYFSIPAWEHGTPLWSGPGSFSVQARRVSGAGNVNVWLPSPYGFIFTPR